MVKGVEVSAVLIGKLNGHNVDVWPVFMGRLNGGRGVSE